MHVVALGHDKKIFDHRSRSYTRQQAYAKLLTSLHVFVPVRDDVSDVTAETLTVHAVKSKNNVVLAWRMVCTLYRQIRICQSMGRTVLIVQSPFEFGVIGLVCAKLTGVPLQVQVHGDFYSQPYWQKESWSNRLRAVVGLCILRRADGVRVVSKRIARSLIERGVSETRIAVLPIEADLDSFFTATPTPLWSPEPDAVYVLSVGRFAPEKNFPLLIEAFYQTHQVHPQARLVLVGEGHLEIALRTLVASLWSTHAPVSFYAWQQQVSGIMKAADIYALSSDHEGYAMVLGEALATGTPVVTTDVGCAGELVEHNVHGLVVPPRDGALFAQALTRLVGDAALRTGMGTAGSKTVTALTMSGDAYAKSLVETWSHLLEDKND